MSDEPRHIIRAKDLNREQSSKWAAGRQKYFSAILRNPSASEKAKAKAKVKLRALSNQ